MNIVIFEDGDHNNFYPVSLTRPVWELRTGCFSLRERWEHLIHEKYKGTGYGIFYLTRDYLAPLFREKYPELKINDPECINTGNSVFFINSRVLPDPAIFKMEAGSICMKGETVLSALIKGQEVSSRMAQNPAAELKEIINLLPVLASKTNEHSFITFDYIWDLVNNNEKMITEDFKLIKKSKKAARKSPNKVTIIGKKSQIYIEKNVRIDPFVCIDLTHGPVVIGNGSVINSFTRIEGPCYIGKNCIILGAKLRAGTLIGDNCRIGGEVEESIFQANSNKYHDGFIGHSYIGEWVNLGALTTNSDLKNNYSVVKVNLNDKRISTDSIKAGCFLGDFTRTSIGTLFNTGTVIGAGCMVVHSGGMAPQHMPSFTCFFDNKLIVGEHITSLLSVCKMMTGRREIAFTGNYESMLMHLHKDGHESRKTELDRWKDLQK